MSEQELISQLKSNFFAKQKDILQIKPIKIKGKKYYIEVAKSAKEAKRIRLLLYAISETDVVTFKTNDQN